MSENIWDKEAPSGGGMYLKIEPESSIRVRFFGRPIEFQSTFENTTSTRFASAVLYRNKATKVNEVKSFQFGWTIQKAMRALYRDDEWGDPEGYDVEISRTGAGKETKYAVVPKPKKALSADELELIESTPVDLVALYVENKKDPFADE
jgi:hypothetical protein